MKSHQHPLPGVAAEHFTPLELLALAGAFLGTRAKTRSAAGHGRPHELKRAGIIYREAIKRMGDEYGNALEARLLELARAIARGDTDRELKQGLRRQRKNERQRSRRTGPTVFK